MPFRVIRPEGKRLSVVSDSFRVTSERLQRVTDVEQGVGEIGFDLECLRILGDGILVTVQRLERVAQVEIRLDKVGPDLKGPLIMASRLVVLAECSKQVAKIVVHLDRMRIPREQVSIKPLSLPQSPKLVQ